MQLKVKDELDKIFLLKGISSLINVLFHFSRTQTYINIFFHIEYPMTGQICNKIKKIIIFFFFKCIPRKLKKLSIYARKTCMRKCIAGKKKKKLFQHKLSYRNETGTSHRGLLST